MVHRQTVSHPPSPRSMNTFSLESRSTWCLSLTLWSLGLFVPSFTFVLLWCSSPLTCLISLYHMPCAHALFFSARCYPLFLCVHLNKLFAFFACFLTESTRCILMCLWISPGALISCTIFAFFFLSHTASGHTGVMHSQLYVSVYMANLDFCCLTQECEHTF